MTEKIEKPTKEQAEWWNNEVVPLAKKHGFLPQKPIVMKEDKWKAVWIVTTVLLVGLMAAMFLYGFSIDAFKSEITQEVELQPNISVENDYDFNPTTDNDFDINLEVTIPEDFCNCECG